MSKSSSFVYLMSAVLVYGSLVSGHGRLTVPPGRSTMWRYGFKTPINYDDNQLFCGGFQRQWEVNGGKCGVCGDPWNGLRENEAGGLYATGTIGRRYTSGDVITARVELTAFHRGWFEFRLCDATSQIIEVTQQCLDNNVLTLASRGGTRYQLTSTDGAGFYDIQLVLPPNMTCSRCVLQWKYHAGNSWGVDSNGKGCVGCGPQEEFYACADIAITASSSSNASDTSPRTTQGPQVPNPVTSTSQPAKQPSTAQTVNGRKCVASGPWTGQTTMTDWCQINCARGFCPESNCRCLDTDTTIGGEDDLAEEHLIMVTTSLPGSKQQTATTPDVNGVRYVAVGVWVDYPGMTKWCENNCRLGFCPASHCRRVNDDGDKGSG